MDPISLIAAGIGTAGTLAKGIYDAAEAPKRKRRWKARQKQNALVDLDRQYASDVAGLTGGMRLPTYELDALQKNRQIDQQAKDQFALDPMSFVPFVQQGTKLAGGLYDAASEGGDQQERLAPDPIARQQQTGIDQQDALERAQALAHFKSVYGPSYQGYGQY